MKYEDYVKSQERIEQIDLIWQEINNSPEKFKVGVENNSKIIFYEDLYKQLPLEYKEEITSAEELKNDLKIYFKCENNPYMFIKSYKDYVLKKFESGYLWNKITSEKKYDTYFKDIEIIDENKSQQKFVVSYTKMFDAVQKAYPKYFTAKKDMKKVLNTYFKNNNINCLFTDDKDVFENYKNIVIDEYKNSNNKNKSESN